MGTVIKVSDRVDLRWDGSQEFAILTTFLVLLMLQVQGPHTELAVFADLPYDCQGWYKQILMHCWASLVAQSLKDLPGMRETWVRSLGREDPLEKEMATHSSTLAWRIPWREKPGRLQSMGLERVGYD